MKVMRAIAAAAALGLIGLSAGAEAQQQFNGRWSVLILTERGECDRAYRYPIAIENGRVRYAGEAGFNITGQVGANGAIQGNIAQGDTRANVRGRLSGGAGSGTWTVVTLKGKAKKGLTVDEVHEMLVAAGYQRNGVDQIELDRLPY